jgi:glycosyltransferase involved in cell wall biosynthesis
VARVVAKLELGGAQLSLLRVARALAGRGYQTRLLAGNATAAGVQLARAHGFEVEVMGSDADLQWECDPEFAAWLRPRLVGADAVHAHMLGAWWAAARVAPDDVPLVASEHNGYAWWGEPPWAVMAQVTERVDRFFAHGRDARAGALRAGVAEDRVRPGISPVAGMDARPRSGLPSPRIVFTGRLSPDKGPDVLIDAIARMAAPPPVLMLGSGVLKDQLQAQVARLGLERVVRFCGWVDEPGPWVTGATVQACPSRDEAFSQTAVLAMALGVPVVGTDVDGFPETLGNGRGVMVSPEDPEALACALEEVLSGRLRPDTDSAHVWAQQFEIGRVAMIYEQTYDELRAGHTAGNDPPTSRSPVGGRLASYGNEIDT